MAWAFGFERGDHYDVSMKFGARALIGVALIWVMKRK